MSTSHSAPIDIHNQNVQQTSNHDSIESEFYQNSKKRLLALYLVVPVCLLIAVLDRYFLNSQILSVLPSQPVHWAFWAIFFNFPHIVSSFITLADKEYISVYKKNITNSLILITILVGLFVLGMSLLPRQEAHQLQIGFLVFVAIYTMYHVMSQQYGLSLMMMQRGADRDYQIWRWSSVMAATIMYMFVFMRYSMHNLDILGIPLNEFLMYSAGILVVISTIYGIKISKSSRTKMGQLYVYGNIAMVITCYYCLHMGYSAFVILMPRVIHDITAFMIYSGHDQNRNAKEYKNFIHKFFSFLRIPPLYLNPILAIGIAAAVNESVSMHTMSLIIIYCGLFHYYMEGIIWKRDAIHRQSLKFS